VGTSLGLCEGTLDEVERWLKFRVLAAARRGFRSGDVELKGGCLGGWG